MVTCYLRYVIDPDKIAEFEEYAKMWLELLPRFGGIHHGYFFAVRRRERYRALDVQLREPGGVRAVSEDAAKDPDVAEAVAFAKRTKCFLRYERSFFRLVLPEIG